VSVPLGELEPARVVSALAGEHVVGSARAGILRLSVHFYNHEDDIARLVAALSTLDRPGG
jgi:selenocysteine lyase/cysteine desulfurase